MGGLFNSTVLDVAVGLIFIYLLLGLFCTTVNEWIAGILKARSKNLLQGIQGLLDQQPLGNTQFLEAFYQHPLVSGMMHDGKHPSYLAARTFATAIMDLVTPTVSGPITLANLVDGINAMPDGDVKKALVALVSNVGGDLSNAESKIEDWFNDTMERVSGWYKRTAQVWTVALAVIITVAANADTIRIARLLWVDPTVRSAVVEQAKLQAQSTPPASKAPAANLTGVESAALGDMIGWTSAAMPSDLTGWLQHILGWAFTAIAVSLGAPFWFDTLNRFINIRSAGKPPEKQVTQTPVS
jgi:hypothetical protein